MIGNSIEMEHIYPVTIYLTFNFKYFQIMLNASLKLRIKWGNLLKKTQVQQEEDEFLIVVELTSL